MSIKKQLKTLKENNLYRNLRTITNSENAIITIDNKEYIDFSSNDYLGLSNDNRLKQAIKDNLATTCVGSSGSHFITGHHSIHETLEEELANYTGYDKTLLFSTGYMANLAIFSALRDEVDWVLQDKLNHASLLDANKLISLPIKRYLHNDMTSLKTKLIKQQGIGLIASDNVFSMDGDIVDSEKLNTIKKDNYLLLDDAHGFGIFKNNMTNKKNVIYMATLGKAVGTMGAFVAGNSDLIDFIKQKARPYIYTTAISPIICAATLKSLEIIKTGKQQQQLFENIKFFKKYAKKLDLNFLNSNSAIQPLIIGDTKKTLTLSDKLLTLGFFVVAIRPPTVPQNSARLRITISAKHIQEQIKQLLTNIKNAL